MNKTLFEQYLKEMNNNTMIYDEAPEGYESMGYKFHNIPEEIVDRTMGKITMRLKKYFEQILWLMHQYSDRFSWETDDEVMQRIKKYRKPLTSADYPEILELLNDLNMKIALYHYGGTDTIQESTLYMSGERNLPSGNATYLYSENGDDYNENGNTNFILYDGNVNDIIAVKYDGK